MDQFIFLGGKKRHIALKNGFLPTAFSHCFSPSQIQTKNHALCDESNCHFPLKPTLLQVLSFVNIYFNTISSRIMGTRYGQSQNLELENGSIKKNPYKTPNKHSFSINKLSTKRKIQNHCFLILKGKLGIFIDL